MTRKSSIDDRQTFGVEQSHLVRTVGMLDGRTYSHRCSLESYTAVARYIDEHAGEGVTTTMLWEALEEVPCTQASVALAFLKERGCLEMRYRRLFPTSNVFFEDALMEFHALAEEPIGPAQQAQAAQRRGDWPNAAALWREAAQVCPELAERERFEKEALWCEDMARLVGEA